MREVLKAWQAQEQRAIIPLQRIFRRHRRKLETHKRIKTNYQDIWKRLAWVGDIDISGVDPSKITLADACKPGILAKIKRQLGDVYTSDSVDAFFSETLDKLLTKQALSSAKFDRSRKRSSVHFYEKFFSQNAMRDLQVKNLSLGSYVPYHPEACCRELARKIVLCSADSRMFEYMHHMTVANALPSIFDHGLLAQETLVKFNIDFEHNALSAFDQRQGDANAVCLGANHIDFFGRRPKKYVRITFESANLQADFFKQKDLGFVYRQRDGQPIWRTVNIGDLRFSFSHTCGQNIFIYENRTLINFKFANANDKTVNFSIEILNELLISHNSQRMHQILVLNFFRLVDKMVFSQQSDQLELGQRIYAELDKLDRAELQMVVDDIGQQFSDTMEFNYIGSRRIDFDSIRCIWLYDRIKIDFKALVVSLASGKHDQLDDAMKHLPEMFNSYRFIDYLLSKIPSETRTADIRAQLQSMRQACKLPQWMEPEAVSVAIEESAVELVKR